ncbi:MAG TPA: hypothetical protein VGC32_07215 [Solirubrobacterales bacterium]
MRTITARLAVLAAILLSLALPAMASATAGSTEISAALSKGVTYLKGLQAESGEIPGFGGDWSLTSLAAAGTAAADVNKSGFEGHDARSWYEGVIGVAGWPTGGVATDYERGALLAYAAGIDPARVSKRTNLLADVAGTYQSGSPGYYGETLNGTVFGLLALNDAKTTAGVKRFPTAVYTQAIAAIEANQHTDGGWTWQKVAGNEAALKSASEPDMTGAAMAALCDAGVPATATTIVKAKAYLVADFEGATGAFKSEFGNNTDSVAWAVDGLKACKIDPQGAEFTGTGKAKTTPLNYLINQQIAGGTGAGGFRYSTGSSAEEYASQDAVRALGSGSFTATPAKPAKGTQWHGVTSFGTVAGETDALALVIEKGAEPLKVCSVTVNPGAATIPLSKVLDAAVAGGAKPSGCVSSYAPSTGTGAITQINGTPGTPEARWKIGIDGGALATAERDTTIHVGDTIYLKFE